MFLKKTASSDQNSQIPAQKTTQRFTRFIQGGEKGEKR
jgi:hypothetical protein